ncbi:MAG: hypothetical protein V4440_10805, partial [Pseudomonadota bacterium]
MRITIFSKKEAQSANKLTRELAHFAQNLSELVEDDRVYVANSSRSSEGEVSFSASIAIASLTQKKDAFNSDVRNMDEIIANPTLVASRSFAEELKTFYQKCAARCEEALRVENAYQKYETAITELDDFSDATRSDDADTQARPVFNKVKAIKYRLENLERDIITLEQLTDLTKMLELTKEILATKLPVLPAPQEPENLAKTAHRQKLRAG